MEDILSQSKGLILPPSSPLAASSKPRWASASSHSSMPQSQLVEAHNCIVRDRDIKLCIISILITPHTFFCHLQNLSTVIFSCRSLIKYSITLGLVWILTRITSANLPLSPPHLPFRIRSQALLVVWYYKLFCLSWWQNDIFSKISLNLKLSPPLDFLVT